MTETDKPCRQDRALAARIAPTGRMALMESYRARRPAAQICPGIIPGPVRWTCRVLSGRTGPAALAHADGRPAAIRRVLLERVEDYPKSEATKYDPAARHRRSLFVAESDHWRWQRRPPRRPLRRATWMR